MIPLTITVMWSIGSMLYLFYCEVKSKAEWPRDAIIGLSLGLVMFPVMLIWLCLLVLDVVNGRVHFKR